MLRTLYKSDLPQLLAIENAVHVAPWAEETFAICFKHHCKGWVVEMDKQVIGFILISFSSEECHLLNVCVAHAHQHQGFGKILLEKAMAYAAGEGVEVMYLEVRESNTRAIAMYEKAGFQLVGKRKGYYPTVTGREDALILARILGSTPIRQI
jgi:ribosomal-protein-alanine N-acetyltransferase